MILNKWQRLAFVRQSCRDGSLNFRTCQSSWYAEFHDSIHTLKANFWTFSSDLISPFSVGFQTIAAYSKRGLINYNLASAIKVGEVAFSELQQFMMCGDQHKLEVKVIPRYL